MSDAPERIWAFYAPDKTDDDATIVAYEAVQHGGQQYVRADLYETKAAEIERLRGVLDTIASYKPLFDYAAPDSHGHFDPNAPGSPFDLGRDQEARHLSGIARAALGEDG